MSANGSSEAPQPHPRDPAPSGILYGDIPLEVPRKVVASPYVSITLRENGITFYTMRRAKDDVSAVVQCKIDTRNEYLLMVGTSVHYDNANNNEARGRCAHMPLARVIAIQQPSDDPDRCMVDHANRDPLDNTAANLHWVTPSFNRFNVPRNPPSSGSVGVQQKGKRFRLAVAGQGNGMYDHRETAALVYDLIIRLKYGSQLDKTPHLLNQVGPGCRVSTARRKPTASRHIADNSIRETRTQQRAAQRSCVA